MNPSQSAPSLHKTKISPVLSASAICCILEHIHHLCRSFFMDRPPIRLASSLLTKRFSKLAWLAGPALALALGLSACGKSNNSDTSSSTSGNKSRTVAPGPSTEVEVRTPAAPDSRGGGSSGPKGSVPTADTSGGPSSDVSVPGAASSAARSSTGNTKN